MDNRKGREEIESAQCRPKGGIDGTWEFPVHHPLERASERRIPVQWEFPNLVQCTDLNEFQCPPSGDDGGGGGDETIVSMMSTVMARFEQDYDSGAGTGGVDITCALASFILTVIDVEEKGYDGRACWRHLSRLGVLRRRFGFGSFEHAHRMMTRTSLPKGRQCLRDGRKEERGLLGIS
ncbi:hypothetical protein BDN72DRAFT_835045 [Pluteus cervinus]|uniref:Uncharacterized protein n=1 Tax=Pluteus cervinus TaxID=181527 RepID=A0ACD3B5Y9_9AGAR|nr:hypothetical protein BDN72DRAFT_835045 [Pluteus cervinus]